MINLSVNTPPRTDNHGPQAAIKSVGLQHLSRKPRLYSEVTHGVKIDAIITHRFVNPRASHVETHLSTSVAAAFPDLSLQFKKHV
jgi:hypothetical protein